MKRNSTSWRPPPYPGTQAVLRAMAILKAFSHGHAEWGVTELARALSLHKTTVFRLLAALEREGMVARNAPAGAYRLGPDAIVLGAQALRSNDVRTAARGELEALARESGETTTLEVLVDDDVLILDEVQGRYLVGTSPSIGTRWPAHAASTGKVLLAAARHGRLRAPYRHHTATQRRLARFTARTITSPSKLDEELARVWKRGYATAIEELEVGFVAIGAAVRNHEDQVVAALSVGGPSIRVTDRRMPELARLVRQAAERVSQHLGGGRSRQQLGDGRSAPPSAPRAARRTRFPSAQSK